MLRDKAQEDVLKYVVSVNIFLVMSLRTTSHSYQTVASLKLQLVLGCIFFSSVEYDDHKLKNIL